MKPGTPDLRKVKTISFHKRKSKVHVRDFAEPCVPGQSVYHSFPNILAGKDFHEIVKALLTAHRRKKPVILGMGAHVLKCGLSPLIAQWLKYGMVTHLALNGAGVIHDVEIALFGRTSEYVEEGLKTGFFGMVYETNDFINECVNDGFRKGLGLGESLCYELNKKKPLYRKQSVLFSANMFKVPVTVHVGIGTDISHMHPSCSGAAYGETSHKDFLKLVQSACRLGGGGVLLNMGSAVILPEVFLKALTLARNFGNNLSRMVGVNIDFNLNYRSMQQVVKRVDSLGGKGYALVGHHEILVPLLVHAVLEGNSKKA